VSYAFMLAPAHVRRKVVLRAHKRQQVGEPRTMSAQRVAVLRPQENYAVNRYVLRGRLRLRTRK